jgi:TPR repeat protein
METIIRTKQYGGEIILPNLTSEAGAKTYGPLYYKSSVGQGYAEAQLTYSIMLATGDGIPMNKSIAAHYYKLSVDQGKIQAQLH